MTSRTRAARLLATSALGLGVAMSGPAWAQQAEVETVIVTASKRAERLSADSADSYSRVNMGRSPKGSTDNRRSPFT